MPLRTVAVKVTSPGSVKISTLSLLMVAPAPLTLQVMSLLLALLGVTVASVALRSISHFLVVPSSFSVTAVGTLAVIFSAEINTSVTVTLKGAETKSLPMLTPFFTVPVSVKLPVLVAVSKLSVIVTPALSSVTFHSTLLIVAVLLSEYLA